MSAHAKELVKDLRNQLDNLDVYLMKYLDREAIDYLQGLDQTLSALEWETRKE